MPDFLTQQQTILVQLGQLALEQSELSILMDEAAVRVAHILNVEYCEILEVLPNYDRLHLSAGHGWQEPLQEADRFRNRNDSLVGYALQSKEPVVIEDFCAETRFSVAPYLQAHGIVSGLCVVLGQQQNQFGLLGVYSSEYRPFTQDDILFLQATANILAQAIAYHHAEQARVETMTSFRNLFEQSNDAIFIYSTAGIILDANHRACEMVGHDLDYLRGMLLTNFHLKEDLPMAKKSLQATAKGEAVRLVTRFKQAHGQIINVEISARVVDQELGMVQAIVRDITQAVQAQQELRVSEERYRAVAETAFTGIITTDIHENLTYVNQAFAQMLGRSQTELIGRALDQVASPETFSRLQEQIFLMKEGLLDRGQYETELIHKDGTTRMALVSISPLKTSEDQYRGSMAVITDITERKRMEEALKTSEARIRAIVDAAGEGIITVDKRGIIKSFNSAAAKMFGYEPDEIIDQSVDLLIAKARHRRHSEYIANYLQTGQSEVVGASREMMAQRQDKSTFPINLSVSKTYLGDQCLFTGVIHDLTQRKALERQLLQAQKLEAIGQLAAGIAHEINSPAQYIGDNVEFLQESFEKISVVLQKYSNLLNAVKSESTDLAQVTELETVANRAQIDYLLEEIPFAIEETLEGIHHVTRIVGAMKEFSHPGVEGKTALNINKAIESTITMARNEWKYVADVETDFDPVLPPVPCLPGEFNQAILNVLINAAHAIDDAVGNGSNGKGKITVTTRRDGDWVDIRIRDTGAGIPEEIRQRLFDPFFTTKEVGRGTGQGLALSYAAIVEKHKGTITFETEIGQGTTFIIRLPLVSEEQQLEKVHAR